MLDGTDTGCIHDKMSEIDEDDPDITLYNKLLNHFNDATDNWLFFEVGTTNNNSWGETSGSWLNTVNHGSLPDTYKITFSNSIDQNGSNLAKMITLMHELIHAYMFDTLSDAGYITFAQNGEPGLSQNVMNNLNCGLQPHLISINLNDHSEAERFAILMFVMLDNNLAQNTDWSHDLFGNSNFSVNTYQQQLASFLLENHD